MNFKKVIASLSAVVIMCTTSVFAASAAAETQRAYLTAKTSQSPVYDKLSNTLYTSSMSYGISNASGSKADVDYLMTRNSSTSGRSTYSCKFKRYYINVLGKSASKTYSYSNRNVSTSYTTAEISTSKTTSLDVILATTDGNEFEYYIAFASWD